MTFKKLNTELTSESDFLSTKIYIKLLALGVKDFSTAYTIIKNWKEPSFFKKPELDTNEIDLLVYEYLSQNGISLERFEVKHILSLTSDEKNLTSKEMLSRLEKIFPEKTKVSSMTPNPIHFGPLERFFSDSFFEIDPKTLFVTISFWVIVYCLIFYFLYR